jgi:mannose-6-phosphate isomerase-like protein (cupin superfamily)
MSISRRDLLRGLPSVGLPAAMLSAFTVAKASPEDDSLPSAAYTFDKLPVRTANNDQFRAVMKGKLATGESLEVHETTLPPGGMPHAAHHHVHSEMWLVREGTIEIVINGSKKFRLAPGDVGFVHSNEEHGVTNVGTTPATYFVVAVGPGAGSV